MKLRASCLLVFALLVLPLSIAQQSPEQHETKEPALMSDARAVLGKVNYNQARELAQHLQNTLRLIKAHQREILTAGDPTKQRELEESLDKEIGTAVEQTIAILSFLQESGFEKVISEHKEEIIKGFTRRSLPPYEREIFRNAGFSDEDFNGFVSFFESHGHEVVVALEKSGGVDGLKDRLRTESARDRGRRYGRAKAYLKIGAGGLAIVGDGALGFIVEIAPPVAFGVLTSVTMGISTIADGVGQLGEQPK